MSGPFNRAVLVGLAVFVTLLVCWLAWNGLRLEAPGTHEPGRLDTRIGRPELEGTTPMEVPAEAGEPRSTSNGPGAVGPSRLRIRVVAEAEPELRISALGMVEFVVLEGGSGSEHAVQRAVARRPASPSTAGDLELLWAGNVLDPRGGSVSAFAVAWAPGYRVGRTAVSVSEDGRLLQDEVTVVLSKGETLTGTVAWRHGAPIPRARIRVAGVGGLDLLTGDLRNIGGFAAQSGGSSSTDAGGAFSVSGLASGAHDVWVTLDGHAAQIVGRRYDLPRGDVEIRISPVGVAEVEVFDAETREPIPHARVGWGSNRPGGRMVVANTEHGYDLEDLAGSIRRISWSAAAALEAKGELPVLEAVVAALGYEAKRRVRVPTRAIGSDAKPVAVYLQPTAATAAMEVRCHWADGRPYSGVLTFEVMSGSGLPGFQPISIQSGVSVVPLVVSEGVRLRLRGELLGGAYRASPHASSSWTITAEDMARGTLVLTLPGSLVPIRVESKHSKRRIAHYMCGLSRADGTSSASFGDEGSHLSRGYRLLRALQGADRVALSPGTWRLSVRAKGFKSAVQLIDVPERGRVETVVFELPVKSE